MAEGSAVTEKQFDFLVEVIKDNHTQTTAGMTRISDKVSSLEGVVGTHTVTLANIYERLGLANGRMTKAEQSIDAVARAVYKDQELKVAQIEWEERKDAEILKIQKGYDDDRKASESRYRWVIGCLLAAAPAVFWALDWIPL